MERSELAFQLNQEASSRLAKAFHRGGIVAQQKGVSSIVTELDKETESLIVGGINKYFPADAIIAEEGGSREGTSGYTWFIDPIDGTRNFTFGIPFFAVSIGYAHGENIEFGLIGAPATGVVYHAERGRGAFKNGVRLSVDKDGTPGNKLILLGLVASNRKEDIEVVSSLVRRIVRVRILGGAALNMCLVAEGHAAATIGFSFKSWDVAAGVLMIEEAGGVVSTPAGGAINLFSGEPISIIGSNGSSHDTIRSLINEE